MLISIIPPVEASDTVTSNDVVISGNYTMSGNFTVSHGTSLTIKPGSVVDMGPYWMKVEGALYANDSTIMSSEISPGSGGHNAGVWDSLTILSGGYASLNNVTISNAKSCLIVEGVVDASLLELRHCLIGAEVDGMFEANGLIGEDIDHEGVVVTNHAQITGASFANMSGGVVSSGTLFLNTSQYVDVGVSIKLNNGTADINDVNYVSGVNIGISVSSGASGTLTGMTGEAVNAISAIDSTGFVISEVNMTGSRLLNSWDAGDLTIHDATFEGTTAETIIDVRTSGHLQLSDIEITGSFSANQQTFDAPWIGISFSGSGDYTISNTLVESTDTALVSTGTGTITISNSTFNSEDNGIMITGISSTDIANVLVNIDQGGSHGILLSQGIHNISGYVSINMPYNQWETGSIGLETRWAEIITGPENFQIFEINGFATSLTAHDSIIFTNYLKLYDSTETGLNLYNSVVKVNQLLQTRVSDYGIKQHDSSNVVLKDWEASYHDTGASICGNIETQSPCSLTIWDWTVISNLNSDAVGAGQLFYPANMAYSTSVDSEYGMWENTIYFQDLSSNSVNANWEINGFTGTAVDGMANVMVKEDGDALEASVGGIGVIANIVGSDEGSHIVQVPLLPTGDWIINSGQDILLGSKPNGQPHVAGGNITIASGGSLTLSNTSLQLLENKTITKDIDADLHSYSSTIIGEIISIGDGLSSTSLQSLIVQGDVNLACESWDGESNSYSLHVNGKIDVGNSCDVKLYSSHVEGDVNTGIGSSLEIVNILEIFVLDKGVAVSGASVTIDGQTVTTSSLGYVSKEVVARTTDSTGTTWAGLKTVTMQSGSLVDLMAWDTNNSLTYTFTASTIDGGEISDWLILEKIWSPYYLSEDLTIPQGQTMTIHDGVELRISEGVQIIVEGTFESGTSTLLGTGGGARWGGLLIGGNSQTTATILGTHLVEASPLIKTHSNSNVVITNALLARSSGSEPLIDIQYSATGTFTLMNSQLTDGSSKCIMAQGQTKLVLNGLDISSCEDESIWARVSELTIESVVAESVVDVTGSSGEITTLSASELIVSNTNNLELNSIILSGPLSGIDVRNINLEGAIINSAPGIDLDLTSGIINDAQINCNGAGVGLISHHGRASSELMLSDSTILNCTKGIDLHSDGESAPFIIENTIINSTIAISSDGYSFEIRNGEIIGSIEANNANGNLVDVSSQQISVTGGSVISWKTHIIDVRLDGVSTNSNLELIIPSINWSEDIFGNSIEVEIPYQYVDENGLIESASVQINSESSGLPDYSTEKEIGPDSDETIIVNLVGNEAPSITLIHPDDGQRFMESLPIEVKALVEDDLDLVDELSIVWTIKFSQTIVMELSGASNNITDLEAGIYELTLSVSDTQGKTASTTISFEITLLDSDGDWIVSCDSDTWFDSQNSVNCGPDIYDIDDDNDAVYDTKDPWPTDACASIDTDGDNQPDRLHCPIGVTTWLVEDQDDDGDGIPDVLEGEDDSTSSSTNSVLVLIIVFLLIGAGAFILLRKRREV